jgi:glycosyltransferase involved in cell wall biosynthesis
LKSTSQINLEKLKIIDVKIKLLFVSDGLTEGGKERRLVELIRFITKRPEFEVNLLLFNDRIVYPEIRDYISKIYFVKRKFKKDPFVFFKVLAIIFKLKPNLIHSWNSMATIYCLPAAKLIRSKFIASITSGYDKKDFARLKYITPFVNAYYANSYAGLNNSGIPKEKGYVIYNGFDFKRLENLIPVEKIKSQYNITSKYIVGMVARFENNKDYATFLNAAKYIISGRDDITFMAVGGGNNLIDIELQFMHPKIIFTGNQNDVETIINIFDIGVLMTAEGIEEGISNSVIEYMALKKAVIATKGGGTDELIIDNETGFLINKNDVKELAAKILELLEDKNLRDEFGVKARERIENMFSIESMVEGSINLYHSLLKKR